MKSKKNVVLPLFLIIILDAMGLSLVLPVITSLTLDYHSTVLSPQTPLLLRNIVYGATLMLYPLGMFFGAPVLGDLSDQFGRKNILSICLVGAALGYAVSGLGVVFNTIALLLLGRFICGLMAGSQSIAQATIADITEGKQRTIMMGFIILAVALGIVIGPLIGGSLSNLHFLQLHHYNNSAPFVVALILSLGNAAWLILAFKETFVKETFSKVRLTKGMHMLIHAFQDKIIRQLSLVFFFFIVSWSLYFQNLPLYLTKVFHYNSLQIGLFISTMGICFSVALGIVTRIAARFANNEIITLIGLAITAISILGSALLPSAISQWICMIPAAIFAALAYNTIITMYSNLGDENHKGFIMGVSGAVYAAGWMITGISTALINYFSPQVPSLIASGLMLVSLIILAYSSWIVNK